MGFDFGSIEKNIEGKVGGAMSLEQKVVQAKTAFDGLKAAISSTNFNIPGTSKFASIVTALDKIVAALKPLEGASGVPPAAQQAATSGIASVQALKSDVQAGKITSQADMSSKAEALIAKYKDQLGPLGSMLN